MKNFTLLLSKAVIVIGFLSITPLCYGATFTAIASGNFSSTATWSGGLVPPSLNTTDEIVISPGVSVHLDQDLTLSGPLAVLNVQGTMTADAEATLTVDIGTITGTGTMVMEEVFMHAGAVMTFVGDLTTDVLNTTASVVTSATIEVMETLELMGGTIEVVAGGVLDLAADATIVISNGVISQGVGGAINLTESYNVEYINSSAIGGIELLGPGLEDLKINVNQDASVTLTSDIAVDGVLDLASGTLVLASNDLTLNGGITADGTGTIATTAASNIAISSDGTISGIIEFAEDASVVNDLSISIDAGENVSIGGDLSVEGTLQLVSGILALNDASLIVNGDITGAGMFSADALSDLAINNTDGLTSSLSFAADGQVIHNLSLAAGDNTVALVSDLTVAGALNLAGGTDLDLSGHSLTLGSSGSINGSGQLVVNNSSDLVIESSAGISSLPVTGIIGNLAINTGGAAVNLGGDVTVDETLALTSGILSLNGNDLTLSGNVAAGGTGTLSTTAVSDIVINASGSLDGTINFTAGASAVNNLIINLPVDEEVSIGGDLTVDGALALNSGILNLEDASLTIDGNLSGAGMLSADASSDLIINHNGVLGSSLNFASGGQVIQNLTLSVGDYSVDLGSDLTVMGDLNLVGGTDLDVSGQSLTLGASGSLSGTGSLIVDAASNLAIESTNGVSSLITQGAVGNLSINTGGATVSLGGDISVQGTFDLASGVLSLNGHDLSIAGNILPGGTGTISADALSSVSVTADASPAGSLNFTAGANTIGNLTIDITGNGAVAVGTDLHVAGNVSFIEGLLDMNDHALTMEASASFSGTDINSYVIAEGEGSVQMNIEAGESVSFPVGTSGFFAPATITLNTGSASGQFHVSVDHDVLSEGEAGVDLSATESVVDATWHIDSDVSANLDMDLEVMWSADMQVNGFDNTEAYISHYTEGSWDTDVAAQATLEANGMLSLERNGITSLSPFAIFDRNTTTATENVNNITFKVYPNPSAEDLIIESPAALTEPLNIMIYSTSGQMLKQQALSDAVSYISLKDLSEGNYFIRFSNSTTQGTHKFTKI